VVFFDGLNVRNGVVQIPKFDAKPNPNPQWLKYSYVKQRSHPTKPGWSKPHTHSAPN